MKLILSQYLASLRERDELDAILPDLLSERGFHVFSRPRRGVVQHGVDVAATGIDSDGEEKLFLFSIKKGDLNRQEWDGSVQALRPSLGEILDAYIPTRVLPAHASLRIVICICLGGNVLEQVRPLLTGFIRRSTNERISFQEWNGDRIAEVILAGALREEIMPRTLQDSFRKAVALVDVPEISFEYFAQLLSQLHAAGLSDNDSRVRSARQMYICLWILFVWARDVNNVEAPYRASERAMLASWDLLRPMLEKSNSARESLIDSIVQLVKLHLVISSEFLEGRIFPHVNKRHAISLSVRSSSAVDVNLKLFEVLGRIATHGLWLFWLKSLGERESIGENGIQWAAVIQGFYNSAIQLIQNNPALYLPITDYQTVEVACFIAFSKITGQSSVALGEWLAHMAERLEVSIQLHSRYPTSFSDYRDLLEHPRLATEEYRKRATAGSTLVPVLVSWLADLGFVEHLERVARLCETELSHCTFQAWVPEVDSESHFYLNAEVHGRTLCDLPITRDGKDLLEIIQRHCKDDANFSALSPIACNCWPLIIVASRHWRLPLPPQFWSPPFGGSGTRL